MSSHSDMQVAQVCKSLSDEQLEQILDLGVLHYVDAFRIDIADAPEEHLAKAKNAWELELSNHLRVLQHHLHAQTASPPLTMTLTQVSGTGQVVGFLLAEQLHDTPYACEIRFVVVQEAHRQQGLLGRMVSSLTNSYPTINLDCKNENYFLGAGFVVTGELGVHKVMQLDLCRRERV